MRERIGRGLRRTTPGQREPVSGGDERQRNGKQIQEVKTIHMEDTPLERRSTDASMTVLQSSSPQAYRTSWRDATGLSSSYLATETRRKPDLCVSVAKDLDLRMDQKMSPGRSA